MTGGATAALTGGVALLERAMGYTLGSLHLVTPEAMSHRTPCREWDLRALLLHMNDSLLALHEAVTAGRVDLDPSAGNGHPHADYGDAVVDPVSSLRNRGCELIGAWASTSRPAEVVIEDRGLTPDLVAATGAVEVAVHGWDVARACGRDRPVPPALAEELLDLCPLLVRAADRAGRFAAPVPVAPLAGPGERLVAFLGRRPS
jgi:uncharacterized protein (TIGR03086 family)